MDNVAASRLSHYIDLDTYPVDDLDSPAGQRLLTEAQAMMQRDTLITFPGFLRTQAVAELTQELSALEATAHQIDYPCTAYGWMDNSGFEPSHPRGALFARACRIISTDMLSAEGPSFELYRLAELTEFVRRLLGYETLYRTVCPTLSIQVNVMSEGDLFGWHFDTNDGVVSFAIRNADEGGSFDFQPLIRDEDDENYEAVGRVMRGDTQARQLQMTPGTMSLFLGRRSLHRVAPVGKTEKSRISLLYSYDRLPNMVFPKKSRERLTSGSNEPYRGAY